MAETRRKTDMGVGLALAFGALAGIAALATTGTGYLYALAEDHTMQVASGVGVALAFVFGGLAIAALHAYAE